MNFRGRKLPDAMRTCIFRQADRGQVRCGSSGAHSYRSDLQIYSANLLQLFTLLEKGDRPGQRKRFCISLLCGSVASTNQCALWARSSLRGNLNWRAKSLLRETSLDRSLSKNSLSSMRLSELLKPSAQTLTQTSTISTAIFTLLSESIAF